jgi:hypothetical protein
LEESDKNACLITQPRMKKQNIMPLMHVQLCRPILPNNFHWLIRAMSRALSLLFR